MYCDSVQSRHFSLYPFWERLRFFFFRLSPAARRQETADSAHKELTRLYESYGNAVLRAAYAYLHNQSDAEDILQDTFLQYLRYAPSFAAAEHEKAWLLRVAINLSKNKLHSAWFRNTDSLTESCPCPEDKDLAFVWEAVCSLPPKYREPIHLFYQEGYSTAEIAQILQQKESTVRSLLSRGRTMLKNILQEAYDFDEPV